MLFQTMSEAFIRLKNFSGVCARILLFMKCFASAFSYRSRTYFLVHVPDILEMTWFIYFLSEIFAIRARVSKASTLDRYRMPNWHHVQSIPLTFYLQEKAIPTSTSPSRMPSTE